MHRVKFIAVFVLLTFALSTGLGTVTAQPLPPLATPDPTHWPSGADLATGVSEKISEDPPLILSTPTDAREIELSPEILWSIWLSVPRYSQNDSRWANDVMQTCGRTIGHAGCLLTSATMVFRYYGSSMDPGQVNSCMGNDACPWVHRVGADRCSQHKAKWYNFFSPSYNTFIWALSEGYPPILELTKPGRTHWVVLYGVSGSGLQDSHYWIIDPSDGRTKSLTSYTGNGWSKSVVSLYGPRR